MQNVTEFAPDEGDVFAVSVLGKCCTLPHVLHFALSLTVQPGGDVALRSLYA